MSWGLSKEGVLTITGTGDMEIWSTSTMGAWYDHRSKITSVVIGDGITSIGASAFYLCTNLTSITIPESVKLIDMYAFAGCSSLVSVTIPSTVTSIHSSVFENCSALTTVTLPQSVTGVKDWAFINCNTLTTVNYGGSQADRNSMSIGIRENTALTNANWVYNYS